MKQIDVEKVLLKALGISEEQAKDTTKTYTLQELKEAYMKGVAEFLQHKIEASYENLKDKTSSEKAAELTKEFMLKTTILELSPLDEIAMIGFMYKVLSDKCFLMGGINKKECKQMVIKAIEAADEFESKM